MDTLDAGSFENARIGEGAIIEPNVEIGLRYHEECGPAVLGKDWHDPAGHGHLWRFAHR